MEQGVLITLTLKIKTQLHKDTITLVTIPGGGSHPVTGSHVSIKALGRSVWLACLALAKRDATDVTEPGFVGRQPRRDTWDDSRLGDFVSSGRLVANHTPRILFATTFLLNCDLEGLVLGL